MRPKPGRERELVTLWEEWEQTRAPKVKGALGGYLMRPANRPGELIGVAIFSDRASYEANANDPEQDKWYRRMRDHLEADPIWEDGEYLAGSTSFVGQRS
ncbi:MAG: hypothetical protein HY690_13370 [Chloroflexi bacterium]|nr:hypothetical protein [Chloroflexota bacterium]